MTALVTSQNIHEIVRKISLIPPSNSVIAIDCETTGLHPYQGDKLRGFSFAFYDFEGVPEGGQGKILSYYAPVGYGNFDDLSLGHIQLLCGSIESLDPVYVYHHAKFDLRFLKQLPRAPHGGQYFSVPPPEKLWDTKVVSWLLDENLSSSLKDIAARKWGEDQKEEQKRIKALVKERGGWDKLTAQDTADYGAKDAEQTLRLYEDQYAVLFLYFKHPSPHGNPRRAIWREMDVQRLLLRVEGNGIMIDSGRLEELLENAEAACAEIELGFMKEHDVNVNSPKQVAELLYDKLKLKGSASRSVARGVLEGLEQVPQVKILLLQRRLRKAISSYLKPLKERTCDDDRIHPTFWSMGTVTGRFSCSDPNLQTIPRGDTLVGVREVFVAPEGYELWEYDLEAAEMRVIAGMADEKELMEGLEEGVDMHARLARQVFGPNFTPLQRRQAKNIGYGFFYGLTSPTTAAKYIDGPDATKTAVKILNGLKALYPNVVKLMRTTQRRAEKDGYIRIHDNAWPGRYRRFVTEADKKPYPYTALNAQIQGGIGEFMKDVMLAIEPVLDGWGCRICLQVHDSLVIEVPEGYGVQVQQALQEAADLLSPFRMRMIFDASRWEDHE